MRIRWALLSSKGFIRLASAGYLWATAIDRLAAVLHTKKMSKRVPRLYLCSILERNRLALRLWKLK